MSISSMSINISKNKNKVTLFTQKKGFYPGDLNGHADRLLQYP